ncbi:caspase family protein [Glacieibacterium megasporae]|uniref:caspase family protein n=1 Tax=Glacieibacterium megasporae TaxID=2835787 RepID=UPI001C1DE3C5|nr:caspase family protein [Polymorphobacter megasporae]UAJ09536.1 caspase family protein [Polymorphobacter megasporae]
MHRLGLHLLAALAAMLLFPIAASAETRVALIIANSHYNAFGKLTNPAADAGLVAAALKKAGFDKVTVLEDLGLVAMNKALQDFGNEADHADVALVYYAGHGVEVDHVNYIVPVDVVFAHDRDVDIEAVKLDRMLSVTENAKRLRIVILDACRDNPFFDKLKKTMAQAGAVSKGMTAVEPSKNSLVIYSAKAGTLASDGRVNSPFAAALARRIVEPGREISLLLRQVRDDVLTQTGGSQEPFTYGSLSSQEFYFIPPVAVAVAPPPPTIDIEAESWTLCKTSQSRGPCDAYLATYASGRYIALAQTRVADLTHTAAAAAENLAAAVAAAKAATVAANNAANVAAAKAAMLAANNAASLAAAYASTLAAGGAVGGDAIAARSTSLGTTGSVTTAAPLSVPMFAATAPPPTATVIVATTPAPSPVTVPPPSAAVVAASPPAIVVSVPSAPVVVTASHAAPAAVAAVSPPPSAPVVAASQPVVVPASAPPVVAPRAAAAPTVLASLGPMTGANGVPPSASASAKSPAGFAAVRINDLGITVSYDLATKAILVGSIERNAVVSGKLFAGDLITRIDTAAPDLTQSPDTQLAVSWKTDGRLKLLVKRGDATSVVIIRSN